MTALTLVPQTPTLERGLADAAASLVLILHAAHTARLPQPVDVVIDADNAVELQVRHRTDLDTWATFCGAKVTTDEFMGARFATVATTLHGQAVRLYHVDTKRRCPHD